MGLILKKLLFVLLPLFLFSLFACHDCSYCGNCIEPACDAFVIEAEGIYGYYDVTAKLKVEKRTTILFKNRTGLSATGTANEEITFRRKKRNVFSENPSTRRYNNL